VSACRGVGIHFDLQFDLTSVKLEIPIPKLTTLRNIVPLMWALVLAQPVGVARPCNLGFDLYGLDEGLSHTTVLTIVQDPYGFMWFGTKDGLNRFDGLKMKSFTSLADDSTTLLTMCWLMGKTGFGWPPKTEVLTVLRRANRDL
jgi:ligand-binding sensor domain-containing protein